jgi:hypothetical protein
MKVYRCDCPESLKRDPVNGVADNSGSFRQGFGIMARCCVAQRRRIVTLMR